MRVIRTASEAEVLASFLRAELGSERWGPQLRVLLRKAGLDESVITSPKIGDPDEDASRAALLDGHRAWLRREGLFAGFPEEVEWSCVALTQAEVLAILYIDWDWWLRVSGGTRLPLDAAQRIRRGEIPGLTAEEQEPIAARLESAEPPPELIVVGRRDVSKLVLVEGHVRLTAFALYPEYLPEELEVFLGTSDEISRWSEF